MSGQVRRRGVLCGREPSFPAQRGRLPAVDPAAPLPDLITALVCDLVDVT
jgi:hypothetical protein